MDKIEVIFAALFLLFTVFAFIRRTIEGRNIDKRDNESDRSADDLPEEMRRMLLGDSGPRTAKPAHPAQRQDPFMEVRDVISEIRRQFEPQTAKPRQGAPASQLPALPPQVPRQPRQAHPLAPEFRPPQPQQTARQQTPPRQAPRAQPPRMVQQQSEGAMPRQISVQQQRPAPMPRRQQQRPQVRMVDEHEGPTTPVPTPPRKKPRAKAPRPHSRWLSSHDDLRRGIILREILGPPKAMEEYGG